MAKIHIVVDVEVVMAVELAETLNYLCCYKKLRQNLLKMARFLISVSF